MRDRESAKLRDHLANERTLLSWLRLSIAVAALGFVVARFGLFVAEFAAIQGVRLIETGYSAPIGVALVLLGPALAFSALLRFRAIAQEIEEERPRRHDRLIYLLIAITVLLGLVLALDLVVVAAAIARLAPAR